MKIPLSAGNIYFIFSFICPKYASELKYIGSANILSKGANVFIKGFTPFLLGLCSS